MDFFEVNKGSDICLVYNGTSCGLNNALWAPNFWLPTPSPAAGIRLGYGYYMVDINLGGGVFLNFPFHSVVQNISGVKFTHYTSSLKEPLLDPTEKSWVHWTRCWIGLKPRPYMAVRFYYLAKEFARGNQREKDNHLRWDYVILNLPGDPADDPTQEPWVVKWDATIKNIAGDIVAVINDL
jgi:hypothetical protein